MVSRMKAVMRSRAGADLSRFLVLAAVAPAALLAPRGAGAQDWDVDASLHQAFSPLSALESPLGFRLGVTGDGLLGPLGLQLSYDRVMERSVDENGYCGAFDCVAGPLDESASLSTLRLSVRIATPPQRPLQVGLSLSGITAAFNQSLKQRESGSRVDSSGANSFGVGVAGDVRFPALLAGLRPQIYAQLERIGSEACVPDAACFFAEARTVKAVGVGVAWHVR
jgi:hypothetical protein